MAPIGFSQPSRAPERPFQIWVVFYVDTWARTPERRIAGAFTSESEAQALLRELRGLGRESSPGFAYTAEPVQLYQRNDDWRADLDNLPYFTISGLHRGNVGPEFRGHRCSSLYRLSVQHPGSAPRPWGLEVMWKTGAGVRMGTARDGPLVIESAHASFDRIDPTAVIRKPIAPGDPFAILLGQRAHRVSVTEEDDGSITSLRVSSSVRP